VLLRDGKVLMVDNPSKMPDPSKIEEIREPIVTVNLYMPQEYVGSVITLCTQKRGAQINISYHGKQVMLVYEMPMAEIVLDFFDKLKSISRGYASMDYEFKEYRAADVVKVDMLINGEKVQIASIAAAKLQPRCASSFPDRCMMWRYRRLSDRISLRGRTSRRCGRMSWRSVMAAILRARRSCLKSKRPGRSA
jgi:GTP-binding protein LepA